jgi:hypothetical protein
MQQNLSELSDAQLLQEAKKLKTKNIINGFLVGFMIGVIVYSIINKSISVFTFIPLVLIYKIVNDAKNDAPLKEILKQRNLK